ncbi:hypothetical protein [Streptomyces sp. NPDC058086]|uniref:hypothetical protein n=1 Tax=Streptomyces sp. NPDC058086 TaxID=3346334 RepID=UPI0036E8EF04
MTNGLPPLPDTPPPPAEPLAESPLETPVDPASAKRRLSPLAAGLVGLATGAAIVGGAWAATGTDSSDDRPGAGGKTSTAVDALRASPDTFTLTGDFKLTDGATDDGLGGCEGTGGYDDIAEGTSVTVYDAAGAVIATGSLGTSSYDAPTCTFDVFIDGVPGGEDFYKVEVSHRGTVQLNADQAKNGLFGASLG